MIAWERKLEIEEERRINHRYEPYVNYLAVPQPYQKERQNNKEGRESADFANGLNSALNEMVVR